MERNKKKIFRACTVSLSIDFFKDIMAKLKSDGYDTVVVTSPGKELDMFRSEYPDIRTIEVPMERRISLFKDGVSLLRMIWILLKERPYVIHSITPKAGLLCMVAGWLTRVPVRIHTFTGLVWPTATGTQRRILMTTDRILCACATHINPEGQGVLNDLKNYGICKKPMKVLGYGNVMGVDMTHWKITTQIQDEAKAIRENLWLTPQREGERLFSFLFVGRLVGDKGINELVESFIRLREYFLKKNNGQKIRLLLVGPIEDELDPLNDITWNRIRSTPSIIEVGAVWDDSIRNYYAASDCFVFPSYREGFPNTVLEAGAMGLPSIVTDINGSREIVVSLNSNLNSNDNGIRICDNGMIVPSKSVDTLYEAMRTMVENDAMRNSMRQNARRMIESRFEKSFVQSCLIDFYKNLLRK